MCLQRKSYVKDFLALCSVSVRQKVTFKENVSFGDYASEIPLQGCSKLTINQKNDNVVTICWHDAIVKFFWRCFIPLVSFNYWPKFHVKIITASGVMTDLFYKGLTISLEISNTPIWVLLNTWRLGWVKDTKFGTDVSNEMLVNAAKCQSYSF